ncbi:DUF4377 domain-containing protein [Bacteroides pyogenes]|uniref:DUF4377 domain-containing protein n=1 Tax=Bacteroides pyogenes TaxID=310300 RepID=UPI001F3A17A0|nr:DUF4377 domain-containing protein [Bacteroides pyogenes]MCE9105887.1 DUF4377 domain-containing protein [Bacteroides pyogenes]MCF2709501.1 DUF4377 domain-containing protein [Bacteroides pyogenes]
MMKKAIIILLLGLIFGCQDDYRTEVWTIASEEWYKPEGVQTSGYWVRRFGAKEWERFTDPIEGFSKIYQQGKEYVIEVGITDRDIYVADLSDEKYTLRRVISCKVKTSDVPEP